MPTTAVPTTPSRLRLPYRALVATVLVAGSALAACGDDAATPSAGQRVLTPGAGAADGPGGRNPAAVVACTAADGSTELQHMVDGRTYTAQLHRPATGAPDTRLPVVVDLHGLYSDGPTQAALTRFRALADQAATRGDGFLVVEPTGQPGPIDGATGWEVEALDEPGRNDAQYLTQLIDTLVAEQCADPSSVFLAGYSNGGLAAAEYACGHPDRVAAIATVAGFSHPDSCTPGVPVVAFHGTADAVVPWAGGGSSILVSELAPPALSAALSLGVEPQFTASASAAACDGGPERAPIAPDVHRSTWKGCEQGADHVLYEIAGGGHTWPGAPEQPDAALVGPTTTSIDATATIWEFFSQHHGQR